MISLIPVPGAVVIVITELVSGLLPWGSEENTKLGAVVA